jgi:hypothetical protein
VRWQSAQTCRVDQVVDGRSCQSTARRQSHRPQEGSVLASQGEPPQRRWSPSTSETTPVMAPAFDMQTAHRQAVRGHPVPTVRRREARASRTTRTHSRTSSGDSLLLVRGVHAGQSGVADPGNTDSVYRRDARGAQRGDHDTRRQARKRPSNLVIFTDQGRNGAHATTTGGRETTPLPERSDATVTSAGRAHLPVTRNGASLATWSKS